ncbi:MAG: hypothetical protein GY856_21055 [bacterium]|nr:hypothetical protein [bacterium]
MWRNKQVSRVGAGTVAALVALVALAGGPLGAADPPHWGDSTVIRSLSGDLNCDGCHIGHQAPGMTLMSAAGNVGVCQSCHAGGQMAAALAISSSESAVPGFVGTSHAFDVPAVNPAAGALEPLDSEMSMRVMDDNVVCSTCHDQHDSRLSGGTSPGPLWVSPPNKVVTSGGAGTLESGGTYSGTVGIWVLIEITTSGDQTDAEFQYRTSDGIAWSAPAPATPLTAGTDVVLTATNLTVTFVEAWAMTGPRRSTATVCSRARATSTAMRRTTSRSTAPWCSASAATGCTSSTAIR